MSGSIRKVGVAMSTDLTCTLARMFEAKVELEEVAARPPISGIFTTMLPPALATIVSTLSGKPLALWNATTQVWAVAGAGVAVAEGAGVGEGACLPPAAA